MWILVEAPQLTVSRHCDNSKGPARPGAVRFIENETGAQRIGSMKIAFGEGSVNDSHRLMRSIRRQVFVVEISPTIEWNSDRLEILRPDGM